MSTRVAVLGTGRMGSAIVRRLAGAGIELVLWNRTRERAEEIGRGTVVATPADAVGRGSSRRAAGRGARAGGRRARRRRARAGRSSSTSVSCATWARSEAERALKLVANSMLSAVVLIAAELEMAGQVAGIAPGAVFDVITRLVPAPSVVTGSDAAF